MVAKRIDVRSKKAGTEQAYLWSSTGKGTFDISESELDGHGTEIVLHLNEDGETYASRWQIEQLIKKYSDHIAYPIFLTYEAVTYDDKKKDKYKKEGNLNTFQSIIINTENFIIIDFQNFIWKSKLFKFNVLSGVKVCIHLIYNFADLPREFFNKNYLKKFMNNFLLSQYKNSLS